MSGAYDFSAKDIGGHDAKLSDYKGKVSLIVNVASHCGMTPQYEGLEALYRKHKDQGFAVLGFPCNQFGAQEPGSEGEIAKFCSTNYDVTFPMFAKIDVNGAHAHPLYEYLKSAVPGVAGTEAIKWNFTKFLVDRDGKVIERYAPTTTPAAIEKDIEKLL
jgi:glutathione peroxidase